MKLASAAGETGDGRLLLVDNIGAFARPASAALNLLAALQDWRTAAPALQAEARAANGWVPIESLDLLAALPRTFQFLDASAFLDHNRILADAWGYERRTSDDPPLMYQGLSDRFFGPADVPIFGRASDQIDFEAEIAVIVDTVPMGTNRCQALDHVRLIVLLNDWSLRAFGPAEMKGGFGFLQAKPPSSLSQIAATPDEFGDAWRDGRLHVEVTIERNGTVLGRPSAGAMSYDFGELIAHAAYTRDLASGTVIGSGTISQTGADEGAGCIAERRALDHLEGREPTPFLGDGERIRLSLACGSCELRIDQSIRVLS